MGEPWFASEVAGVFGLMVVFPVTVSEVKVEAKLDQVTLSTELTAGLHWLFAVDAAVAIL